MHSCFAAGFTECFLNIVESESKRRGKRGWNVIWYQTFRKGEIGATLGERGFWAAILGISCNTDEMKVSEDPAWQLEGRMQHRLCISLIIWQLGGLLCWKRSPKSFSLQHGIIGRLAGGENYFGYLMLFALLWPEDHFSWLAVVALGKIPMLE